MTPIPTYSATLIGKRVVAEGVFLYTFKVLYPHFSFASGQYIILTVPTQTGQVKRLYSIASSSSQLPYFDLLVKNVEGGVASNYLKDMLFGSVVSFSGPAGQFFYQVDQDKEAIFLATGTGFAPLRSILYSCLPSIKSRITLFWGVSTIKDICLFDELLILSKNFPNFSFTIYLSRENSLEIIPAELRNYFRIGRINNAINSMNDQKIGALNYYFCGSRDVVESIRLLLLSRKVDASHLHFEKY